MTIQTTMPESEKILEIRTWSEFEGLRVGTPVQALDNEGLYEGKFDDEHSLIEQSVYSPRFIISHRFRRVSQTNDTLNQIWYREVGYISRTPEHDSAKKILKSAGRWREPR